MHHRLQQWQKSMLKIQRTANGEKVVFVVSGRLEADSLRELSALLALELGRSATLELQDLDLVDRDAVEFLRVCEGKGIVLRNCPAYIRAWMASDGGSGGD